jgi:transposase
MENKGIDIEALIKKNDSLEKENASLNVEILYLKQELAQFKRLIFGSKSEKHTSSHDGQLSLDMGLEPQENQQDTPKEILVKRKISNTKKSKPVRCALPAHLPRQEFIIEPENKTEKDRKFGEEITEILEYIPGKFYVKRFVRPKYITENQSIIIAELPTVPLPKSNAGASLLAHLFVSKFVDHLPFYRQVQMYKRENMTFSESTINDWFSESCRLLEPLYDFMVKKVTQSNYLQSDETPIKVLTSNKKEATHRGYHWVFHSPRDGLICFHYDASRSAKVPEEFLKDFKGILQTDAYSGYNQLSNRQGIVSVACMAHIRRKFFEAKENDAQRAEKVLNAIAKLYQVERIIRNNNVSADKILKLRHTYSRLIMNDLEKWFKSQLTEVLPKSKIGQAIAYALGIWSKMEKYLDHPEVQIDNNQVENSIRPVAIGRKNYLFAGSHQGAKRAAMMYTFFASCKKNNVNPQQWLTHTLTVIQDYSIKKLEELMPNNFEKIANLL